MSSTALQQLEPAQYLPLPGGSVVLPPNARPDLAFEQAFQWQELPQFGSPGIIGYNVPQNYYAIVLFVFASLIVNAASGTQLATLTLLAGPAQTVFEIPAVSTQLTNTINQYTFANNVAAAYVTNATYQLMPLPIAVAAPGATFILQASGAGSNLNLWNQPFATTIFVPTGPAIANELSAPPAAPVPVPLFT